MLFYRDLNDNTPKLKADVFDIDSIKQGITSLVLTRPGEVLFQPEYGVFLESFLFELMDDAAALELFGAVVDAVKTYEPRVKLSLSQSNVTADPDTNSFEVELFFQVVGFEDQGLFSVSETITG